MAQPSSYAEYLIRFKEAQQITGYGITGVTNHFPCPFCAAPDWLVTKVIEVETNIAKDTKCHACGRSCKAEVTRTHGGVSFEFVQTGGPDQPEWLEPKMRRV